MDAARWRCLGPVLLRLMLLLIHGEKQPSGARQVLRCIILSSERGAGDQKIDRERETSL